MKPPLSCSSSRATGRRFLLLLEVLMAVCVLTASLAAQAVRSGFAGATMPAADDLAQGPVTLGFTANFFNNQYTAVYASTNGYVTFGAPKSNYNPEGLIGNLAVIIAPFFADVDTSGGAGTITYGTGTVSGHPAFAETWTSVGYYSQHGDKRNTFQVVLISRPDTGAGNFDIEFNYNTITWEAGDTIGSGGVNGFCATSPCGPAVGYSNGLSASANVSYERPGSHVPGAFLDGSPTSLRNAQFGGSGVPGRLIFPVRNGVVQAGLSTTCPTNTATVGAFYSSQLVGSGGTGNYTWSLVGGSLAPLTLSSTGLVSGTPNVATTLNFTLRITSPVTEGTPLTQDQPCTIVVQPAMSISCIFPVATAGVSYSASCDVVGGTAPYTWSAPGSQTSWLTGFPSAGGGTTITFAGTPPTPPPSSYSFTVTVSDSSSPTQSKFQPVTINIGSILTVSCPVPAPATGGTAYSTSCTTSGGTPPYRWTYSGSGTSWLTGTPTGTTVTLSGTPPNSSATYTVIATVTDNTLQSKSQTIT